MARRVARERLSTETLSHLQIALSGTVTASNFNEWKHDLLARLDAADRKLQTDDDFAHATDQIKSFKLAEDSLKNAKRDALNQVSDIQSLFAAIDEVIERTRETRLSLNKQVNARKDNIKTEIIDAGKSRIRSFINAQPDCFQQQAHDAYLNHNRFDSATKRKTTTATLKASIDQLCLQIETEIKVASAIVQTNQHRIDSLVPSDRELFPDAQTLLSQPIDHVEEIIRQRTTSRHNRIAAGDTSAEPTGKATPEQPAAETHTQPDTQPQQSEHFRITLDFSGDEASAKAYARHLRDSRFARIAPGNIRLERRPG